MAVEEIDEETRGKLQHAASRGRPDRPTHRDDVAFDEGGRVALALQVFAERQRLQGRGIGRVARGAQQLAGPRVEAQDVGDHAEEARVEGVTALRK